MKMKKTMILFALAAFFAGCSDLMDPADENNRGFQDIYEDAAFAEGLLLNGYIFLPNGSYSFNDVATDDAVSNDVTSSYRSMATGQWSAISNPVNRWGLFSGIQYLNLILTEADKVQWASTGHYVKEMFNDRTKGEAYGLRAILLYYLLQAHGGPAADGKFLGVYNFTSPWQSDSDFNIPRANFKECVDQILNDLDRAEDLLPLDFEDIASESQIPSKYSGKTSMDDYNRVFGKFNRLRLTSRIVKGVRAQVTLMAASPAFSEASGVNWSTAADAASEVLDLIGGAYGLADNGAYWYASRNASEISGLGSGENPKEILWRNNLSDNNDLEKSYYPPTLYGSGRINPTQNLVDAFPMANGYPITDSRSGYNASDPYANRDPRLEMYIVVNGSTMGAQEKNIYTETNNTNDGLNMISTSTRTGYYMRKLLREDVNLDPTSTNTQKHVIPRIRYTEIFLAYAEAANEAWGPDGRGTHAYSARDVIAAIRQRAGISQPDEFLGTINSKDDMRRLIRNERRLELCFEGFRFWDLRRWLADLDETAEGVRIVNNTYTKINVENREYKEYMNYGPIPYTEIVKFGQLQQNKGW